jgi:flagellar motor switch protein FliN/FliY
MTADEALLRIGESTGAAVAGALEAYCPGSVECAPPAIVDADSDPVAGVTLPAVAADVSYVDGVRGGNLFLMPLAAVRALAAAMMGADPAEAVAAGEGADELSELELSAAGEVANQMMAAAAAGMSTVLGQEVEIAAPETRVVPVGGDAMTAVDSATAVVAVPIDVLGHRCRLVQLVPHAFVVRMTRALDDLDAEFATGDEEVAVAGEPRDAALPAGLLGEVGVRVAAELGRVSMTIRRAVNLAPGAVVELDRELEDPIDLYVNGRRFGTGRLVTLDGDEWAVRIDTVAFETAPRKGE